MLDRSRQIALSRELGTGLTHVRCTQLSFSRSILLFVIYFCDHSAISVDVGNQFRRVGSVFYIISAS